MDLTLEKYQEKKEKLRDFRLNFKEVETSTRSYLQIKSNRYYLENKGENRSELSMVELGLINQISRAIKRAVDRLEPLPDIEGLPNYCMYNFENDFETDNIYEVDIKAAYPTAAKNRNLLPSHLYDKFFMLENEEKAEAYKMPLDCENSDTCEGCKTGAHIPHQHKNQYICKDTGAALKYSKQCRLISLGVLAQRKKVVEYSAEWVETIEYKNKRVHTTAHSYKRSEPVKEYEEYNQNYANAFFRFALDIDDLMINCFKDIEGVYFSWTDAIFCTKEAAQKVADYLENRGYDSRITKHDFLTYTKKENEVLLAKKDKSNVSPYKFNKGKHINNICVLEDTAKLVKKEIGKHKKAIKAYDRLGVEAENEAISKVLEISVKQLKSRLKKSGYKRALDYALFYSAKQILNINSLKQFNMDYFVKILNLNGLNHSDFVKVKKTFDSEVKYKDCTLEFFTSAATFIEAYQDSKEEPTRIIKGVDEIGVFKETLTISDQDKIYEVEKIPFNDKEWDKEFFKNPKFDKDRANYNLRKKQGKYIYYGRKQN